MIETEKNPKNASHSRWPELQRYGQFEACLWRSWQRPQLKWPVETFRAPYTKAGEYDTKTFVAQKSSKKIAQMVRNTDEITDRGGQLFEKI